jgi:inner membrane protein
VDNITHSLFAVTLANAGLRRAGRGSTTALVIASNIPDIEILTALTGGRVGYLAAHRGPTHGPLGLALALATGALVWLAVRFTRGRGETPRLGALVAVSAIGVVGHIAMDFATSYGTRVLSPFNYTWYGVDWLPIVDVVLWVILTAGVIACALKPGMRVRIAAAVLLLAGADYALRAAAHHAAITEAVALDARSDAAERPGTVFHYLQAAGQPTELPAALPTVVSPFEWRVVHRVSGGFEVRTVDLFTRARPSDAIFFPDQRGPLVDRASTARLVRMFLEFSRITSVDVMPRHDGGAMVHWYDLRFAEHPMNRGDGRRYTSPFAVWVHLSADGAIVGQGLGPG